jgi:hypothetical protein
MISYLRQLIGCDLKHQGVIEFILITQKNSLMLLETVLAKKPII